MLSGMPPMPAKTTPDLPAYWAVVGQPCPRCNRNFGKAVDLHKHSTGGLCMGAPDTFDTNTLYPSQTLVSKGSWFKLLDHFEVINTEGDVRELSPGMMGMVFDVEGNRARVQIPGITELGSLWLDVSCLEIVVLKGMGRTESTIQSTCSQDIEASAFSDIGMVPEARL